MAPTIRFATGGSGQRVAYAVDGDGPPLVWPAWWVSHLERDWEQPDFRRFFAALAETHTVVRYDRPGVGLSDRERASFELGRELADLEAIVDHLELERVSLFGFSCGGPVALAYAHAHPARVDRLVLFGAYAHGASLGPDGMAEALTGLVRTSWGLGSRTLADVFAPRLSREELDRFGRDQRASASGEMAAQLLELAFELDVRSLVADVRAPTLVLHRRDDPTVAFDAGRDLAASIPGATFTPLAGRAHMPWQEDDAELLRALRAFLGVAPVAPVADAGPASWLREGELWRIHFDGRDVHLRHSKGLADLAVLVASPGRDVAAAELTAGPGGAEGSAPPVPSGADPVLDDRARAEFRTRLTELDRDLAEAESAADLARLERLGAERDALLAELSAATGLGGRERTLGDPSERARKAVSARIREAIRRIGEVHPALAAHLEASVSTGHRCRYDPEPAVIWRT